MLIGNKMKSTMGDLVASEMDKIVSSEEHIDMFSKVAKKKEKEDKDEDKKDKKGTFPFFKKKDKKDDEKDDKEPKKKDKKSKEKDDKGGKKKKGKFPFFKKKEMTAESMSEFVNLLTQASSVLDECGFSKSSSMTLQALDTLITEVAISKFADPDDVEGLEGLEDFEKDPELAKLLHTHRGEHEMHDDPALELELAGIGDDVEPTHVFDDIDEANDTSVLKELGLANKELGLANKELGLANKELGLADDSCADDAPFKEAAALVNGLMAKHSHMDDEGGPGFDYSSDPGGEQDLIRMPHKDPRIADWKKYKDLSHEQRLEHEMGAGLHEQLDVDPDTLTWEDLHDFENENFDPDENIELGHHNDYDDANDGPKEDKEFEKLLHDLDDEEENGDEFESLRKALEESGDVSYDDDGNDFEDEE